jgi:hypothetical protein
MCSDDIFVLCISCNTNKMQSINFKKKQNGYYKTCNECYNLNNCMFCNTKFCHNSALLQHIKRMHYNMKDISCDICGLKFYNNSNLKDHVEKVHNKIECCRCNLKFHNMTKLNIHVENDHKKIKDVSCDICDLKFYNSVDLHEHIKYEHNLNNMIEGFKDYLYTQELDPLYESMIS